MKRFALAIFSFFPLLFASCGGNYVEADPPKPAPKPAPAPAVQAPPPRPAPAPAPTTTAPAPTKPAATGEPAPAPKKRLEGGTVDGGDFQPGFRGGKKMETWIAQLGSGDREKVLEAIEVCRTAGKQYSAAAARLQELTKSSDKEIAADAATALKAVQ